jgi:DNA-binding response OmpR family regulator
MKILLVEDDENTANVLTETLSNLHYTVNTAIDGQVGLQWAQSYEYDAIVLDVVLPELDGISICRQLRAAGNRTPILLLTACDSSEDRVAGLEAGADDYLVKPFALEELIARIRALLRRGNTALTGEILMWEKLELNPSTGEVNYDGRPIHLTPKEYGLLELFLRHPRRIFSRSAIIDRLWSMDEYPGEEAVTTHIKGLRQKLKSAGIAKDLLETVYGLGYRLKNPPKQEGKQEKEGDKKTNLIPSEAQAQVMAVVEQIWLKYRDSFAEKIALFDRAIALMATGNLDERLRQQARHQAHQLVGSLGSFGLPEGSKIAREIERLFQADPSSETNLVCQLQVLLISLKQIVESKNKNLDLLEKPELNSARILAIDDDPILLERLRIEATIWGLQLDVAANSTEATEAIANNPPDVILLDLVLNETGESGLMLLERLHREKPTIPIAIFTARNRLQDRLEAARLGASTFLHKSLPPAEVLKAIVGLLDRANSTEAKVMAVDDDRDMLNYLSALLQPWGIRTIALQDPQKFWEVLEATTPDLLILDLEMPKFSGIDLCQVVRNDYRTCQMPILFLSAHTGNETLRQVFAVGADDYLAKPIVEPVLITRVLHRLERTKLAQKPTRTNDEPRTN